MSAPATMPSRRNPLGHAAATALRFSTTSQAPMPAKPRPETSPAKRNPVVPETTSVEPTTVIAAPTSAAPTAMLAGRTLDLPPQPPGQPAAQDASRGVADVVERPEWPWTMK